jgi:hypothetical protein
VPQEFLGQGLDVGPGEGISEDQLQEFVILERGCASLEKATPQALAVPVIMGLWRLGIHHVLSLQINARFIVVNLIS